jgi:hypothetical protein
VASDVSKPEPASGQRLPTAADTVEGLRPCDGPKALGRPDFGGAEFARNFRLAELSVTEEPRVQHTATGKTILANVLEN